jgi:hypothetical protein
MKIRNGFVSNSRSSSFVCDFCGEEVSGMDMEITDAGMVQCANGHIVCTKHILDTEITFDVIKNWFRNNIDMGNMSQLVGVDYSEWRNYSTDCKVQKVEELLVVLEEKFKDSTDLENDFIEYHKENNEEWRYSYPSFFCPLCTFVDLTYSDIATFYLKQNKLTKKEFVKEVKEKFNGNYEDFLNYNGEQL